MKGLLHILLFALTLWPALGTAAQGIQPVLAETCASTFASLAPKKPARGAAWLRRLAHAAADERKFRDSLTGFTGPLPTLRYLNAAQIRLDIPARPQVRALSVPYVAKQKYAELSLLITRRDGRVSRIPVFVPPERLAEFRGAPLTALTDALTHLPEETIYATKGITFPYTQARMDAGKMAQREASGFAPSNPEAASTSDGMIHLYADAPPSTYEMLLVHEHGHNIAQQIWRDMNPGPLWELARKKDRLPISVHASLSSAEDFAEAVRIYLVSQGKDGRDQFRARYELLDRIFDPIHGGLDGETWRNISAYYALRTNRPRYIALAGTTLLGATAGGYWLARE